MLEIVLALLLGFTWWRGSIAYRRLQYERCQKVGHRWAEHPLGHVCRRCRLFCFTKD